MERWVTYQEALSDNKVVPGSLWVRSFIYCSLEFAVLTAENRNRQGEFSKFSCPRFSDSVEMGNQSGTARQFF